MSSIVPRPKIVRTSPKNEQDLQNNDNTALPPPVSSNHKSGATRTASRLVFADGRWKRVLDALKRGTGYATKQPEWSNSLLDVSDDGGGTTTSVDGGQQGDNGLEGDDVTWLSGKDNEDTLALILVERDLSANSQTSPYPTASQDNLTTLAPPNNTVQPHPIPDDRTYRLKGYEPSVREGTITPWFWLRYRALPWIQRAFMRFFYPEFGDPKVEAVYSERVYESQKFLAFVCSTYLLVSWAIALTLLPKRPEVSDKTFYWAIAPALTAPLPLMIFYDLPKRVPVFYQCFLVISIWSWSAYLITFMQLCRYYGGGSPYFSCAGRDMLNLFYYMVALPVIALFGMGQQRIYATIAPIIMIVTPSALFIPHKSAWARFALEHIFLQALLLYIHWRREILERNVYFFNKKVKDTLIALHHTRLHQSRVEAARARSTSYIFHEVRQPLNAAFLAYQNLVASAPIKPEFRFEWDTLRIKLTSMSKLLNDVLDQNRMDAGKFEIVSRPYAFHSMIRQVLFTARLGADIKKQEVVVDLDPNIDMAARIATYHAQQKSDDEIYKRIRASPSEDGMMNGDETRLTQVLTNLITNATKFTPENGKIRIVTRLVSPTLSLMTPRSSTSSFRAHGRPHSSALLTPPETGPAPVTGGGLGTGKWDEDPDRLVVRIEVIDNGCGISPSDVKERHLFSPYAQAGVGRFQGGSGSGLGLSLVRRIVKLMNGRMGVESTAESGTTFWVELPFKVASVNSSSLILPPLSSPKSSYTSNGTTNVPSAQGSTGTNAASLPLPLSPASDQDMDAPRQHEVHSLPTPKFSDASENPGGSTDLNRDEGSATVGTGITALIVDDDPVLRTLLGRLLRRLGCVVDDAENGRVALQKLGVDEPVGVSPPPKIIKEQAATVASPASDTLKDPMASNAEHPFDVVFLDNQMPVMTGIEVASALRGANRHDFVVGLTGEARVSDQERFLGAGVDEVLSKPVLESQLRAVLQKARARQPKDQPPRHLLREHQPP